MKIGTSMRADWLDRPDDLRYLKQIGVDCVDIVMSSVPGYGATGRLTREGVTQCVDAVGDAGLAHRTHQQHGQRDTGDLSGPRGFAARAGQSRTQCNAER